MASPARCVGALTCLLALSSAQIIFNTGTTNSSSTCELNGKSGTCKPWRKCPANLVHARNRDTEALRAAKSACDTASLGDGLTRILCCADDSQPVAPTGATFQNHHLCGTSEFAPPRVVGGKPVLRLTYFPWMALLKWRPNGRKRLYRCGGTVINERWVLTAAHCITDNGPVAVRVRDLDLSTDIEDNFSQPPEDIPVARLFKHPMYRDNRGLFSDIALIKLNKDIVFSDVAKPLCLPERKRSTAQYESLMKSYIAGWGLTEFEGDASTVMMWAIVKITDHHYCQTAYAKTGGLVDDSEHLCTSGNDPKQHGCVPVAGNGTCMGGVDACEGDSGGPLMEHRDQLNRQRWYAIGVVSYGTGCGLPQFPGVYTRVDHFMDWIAETVSGN